MIKILFVCHGNICRSPMAAFLLRALAARAGREEEFQIDSAAVSREEIGNPLYGPARRELEAHGIPCRGHRARQITRQDCTCFDRIYYMDRSNARHLEQMFPQYRDRFRALLPREVADPWYTGDFARTWEDLMEGCGRIMEETDVQ